MNNADAFWFKTMQRKQGEAMEDFKETLKAMHVVLDKMPVFKGEEGNTAQLVDENRPDGDVVIKRKDGTPIMTMPRETWDQLREYKP